MRKQIRAKDLADLRAKRAPVDREGLKTRVRSLFQSAKAKTVAANCAKGLRKVCREVKEKSGAATRG